MTLESLARTIAKASALSLLPWQLHYLRALDEYYASAADVGISREDATKSLSVLMSKARGSRRYSPQDAFRDARRARIPPPNRP